MNVDAFGRCSRCGEQAGTGGCFNLSCISKTLNVLQAEIREMKQPKSFGDAGLRSLFKMQEALPYETGINLAAGIEMGTRITLEYVKHLEAAVEAAKQVVLVFKAMGSTTLLPVGANDSLESWQDAYNALRASTYSGHPPDSQSEAQTSPTPTR